MRRRGELRLIERAIKKGWAIPEAEQQRTMALVESTLADPTATTRERRACRLVVEAIQKREAAEQEQPQQMAGPSCDRA